MYLLTDSLLRIKGASSLSAALRRARVVMKDARRDVARSCVIFVDTELDIDAAGVLEAKLARAEGCRVVVVGQCLFLPYSLFF